MKILVIVESPSKCKKIEKYLNDNDSLNIYEVVATMGHITELNSLKNIDVDHGFKCVYTLCDLKKKQIDLLRKKIKETDEVIIATDDDREGESIGYHVCSQFGLDLKKTKRIIFHEITESAIIKAIQKPTVLDMKKVEAQQARQIMDLLVGFQISPQLWKNLLQNNALSAGRCQSPALRLIYENQKEIDSLDIKQVYSISGCFFSQNICFHLDKKLESKEVAETFLENSANFSHVFSRSEPTKSKRKQPDPFTTSKLQQACSNELHLSPKETMRICQHLYEAGFITYMRTDSKVYSAEFLEKVKEYICKTFDKTHYLDELLLSSLALGGEKKEFSNSKKKAKVVLAQEAHEAIRPTDISVSSLDSADFDAKEKKVYQLIWRNTLESCLPPASVWCVKIQLSAFDSNHFIYTSEIIDFPGYKIVKPCASDNDPFFNFFQTVKCGTVVPFNKIEAKVSLKNQILHFTEAHLVHLLEEKGIGRPSTFSSLVDKIQEKEYVKKMDIPGSSIKCIEYVLDNEGNLEESELVKEFGNEKMKLKITPLGIMVSEFLEKHFSNVINFEFTKEMEDNLDKVAKSETDLVSLCTHINNLIKASLTSLGEEQASSSSSSSSDAVGVFEDCSVYLKKGKFGLYAEWTSADGEKVTRALKGFGNRPIESLSFNEDILPILKEGSPILREITKDMSIRRGPKGSYIYFKPPKFKKPAFYSLQGFAADYNSCDLNDLKSWIKEKYNIF